MEKTLITDIRLRPYDPSSGLARNFPLAEAFDERRDFVLSRNVQAVAVLLEVRARDTTTERQAVNDRYTVVLMDTTSGEAVCHERVHVCINPWDRRVRQRTDLPVRFADIAPAHEYEVWVMSGWRELRAMHCRRNPWLPAYSHPLGLYPLRRMPARNYCRRGAWIEDGRYRLRNATLDWHGEVSVVFALHAYEELCGHQPEFRLHVTAADGERQELTAKYRSVCDETGNLRQDFEVECEINLNYYSHDVLYLELRQFDTSVASMTIDTRRTDSDGLLTAEETEAIHNYRVEEGRRLMDERFGEMVTEPAQEEEEDDSLDFLDDDVEPEEPAVPMHMARVQLDEMVGLADVKTHVESFAQLVSFARLREEAGLSFPSLPMHSLFLGSPGTGKTTVAKAMGGILHELGVLSRGHVVVKERSMFVGSCYGQEEERTREALEEARGGILFIDEAYQLHQPSDPKDPGHFVLDALMTALADEDNRDWMLIMAGYTRPMLKMLELNPGLSSRLPATNHYYFEDYAPAELAEIARRYLASQQFAFTPEADAAMLSLLTADHASRGEDFGNARHVLNIVQTQVLPRMAQRVMHVRAEAKGNEPLLRTIEAADIPQPTCRPQSRTRRTIGFNV